MVILYKDNNNTNKTQLILRISKLVRENMILADKNLSKVTQIHFLKSATITVV